MTTETLDRRAVEFYATSPRLIHAYRTAAKRNKRLARCAEIQELVYGGTLHQSAKHVHAYKMVVLSHADDDHRVLTDSLLESVFSEAFHLLFTEPATHPGQVAQWMRTTNIRSENRLHVVKVDDLEAPQVSQLLGRVCFALGRDSSRGSIIDAYLAGNSLLVRGSGHRMLHVPVSCIPALKGQPARRAAELRDRSRRFVYPLAGPRCPSRLEPVSPGGGPGRAPQSPAAERGFNERYGAAIRTVREAAGILQSKVEELTERQLRRIEQGECRATTAALTALAKAHGLDVNAYMERLAKAMQ